MAETQKAESVIVNGVDVDQLFGTIDAVKNAPVIGKFKFRAKNKWINGGLNKTSITNFYGTQKDHDHNTPFELSADEPALLLGNDQGPNPVEEIVKLGPTYSPVYDTITRAVPVIVELEK